MLAHEAGAQVQLLARAGGVHWLKRSARLHTGLGSLGRALYAPTDVGPAGLSWVVAAPSLMHRLPNRMRRKMIRRCVRPAATAWLMPRAEGMKMTFGRSVVGATAMAEGHVQLTLDDGSVIEADHVLLGTGYRPDIASVSILADDLRDSVRHRDGHPRLRRGFETSVPGLHAVGALAADSFGPVMRFVSGTWYTAPVLAGHIAARWRAPRRRRRPRRLSATVASADVAQPPT
ncbi:MAG TPA: FAD-dependent oxidoreductase [Steroidobacteraceae bacterium]